MNNKGFTLVELLVTITILGIIAGMSFPMLRKLSEANQQKKYKVYAQSLVSSAKLYVDSYGDDLFGDVPYGCATITYADLKDKLATKDIQTSNLSCNSKQTYVKVTKSRDNYSYVSQIGCGTKKSDNSELNDSEVTVTYSLGDNVGDCPKTETGYSITSDPNGYDGIDKKNINVNVIIDSITGINKSDGSIKLYYKWTTEKNASVNDSDWKEIKFNSIPTNSKQEKEILKGKSITIKSKNISTPSGQTGKYYLAIWQEKIYDIYMSDIVKEANKKNTIKYIENTFTIDNSKPNINTFTISSKDNSYNSLNTVVNINVNDVKYTSNDKLKIYTYESSESVNCSDINIDNLKNNKVSSNSSGNISKDLSLSGKQDGKTRTIKLVVEDLAKNRSCKEITYTPAIQYNINYSLNNGSYGSNHPTTAYTGQEITISNPKKSVTVKFNMNNQDATISSLKNLTGNYTFTGWTSSGLNTNSAKYGINSANMSWNGTTTTNTKFKDLTTTYNETVTMSASYSDPTITLPTIAKTGYTCKWTDTSSGKKNYELASGGKYKPNGATEQTFYAYCTKNSYKLTYNDNGGSGCSSQSITKKYNDTWGTLCTPSKTGYVFNGWYNGGTKVTSSTSVGASDINVRANWTAKTVKVNFHKNDGGSSVVSQEFTYGVNNQKFGYNNGTAIWGYSADGFGGWVRKGYKMLGWNTNSSATTATYSSYSDVTDGWINASSSTINLYAIWNKTNTTMYFCDYGGDANYRKVGSGKTFVHYVPSSSSTYPYNESVTRTGGTKVEVSGIEGDYYVLANPIDAHGYKYKYVKKNCLTENEYKVCSGECKG